MAITRYQNCIDLRMTVFAGRCRDQRMQTFKVIPGIADPGSRASTLVLRPASHDLMGMDAQA